MGYSTVKMVRLALSPGDGNVTDEDNPSGTAADLDDKQLADAIAEADAQIDSYIGARYATPVGAVTVDESHPSGFPHPIDYWSRNIAAYNATLTNRGSQDFTDNDPVARRWKATMDQLNAVQSGTATLPIPPVDSSSPGAGAGAGEPINAYSGNLFTADNFDLVEVPVGWPFGRGYGDGRWRDWWE